MLHTACEPTPETTKRIEPRFVVGQDSRGCWLAIEANNLCGGIFKSREDALHFVDVETDHRPGLVELATTPLQLHF